MKEVLRKQSILGKEMKPFEKSKKKTLRKGQKRDFPKTSKKI